LHFGERAAPGGMSGGSGAGGEAAAEEVVGEIGEVTVIAMEAIFGFPGGFLGVFFIAADVEFTVEFSAGIDGEGLGEEFAMNGAVRADFHGAGAEEIATYFSEDIEGSGANGVQEGDVGFAGDEEIFADKAADNF
jgi:hypothetical protein